MIIFEQKYKINFVDDANTLVGFDNRGQCCESFGWFLSRHAPTKIGEGDEEAPPEKLDAEGFNFDPTFFQEVTEEGDYSDCGGLAVFRLTKGGEELFLTLYNHHNGYYSHGFHMEVGGVRIHDGSL